MGEYKENIDRSAPFCELDGATLKLLARRRCCIGGVGDSPPPVVDNMAVPPPILILLLFKPPLKASTRLVDLKSLPDNRAVDGCCCAPCVPLLCSVDLGASSK